LLNEFDEIFFPFTSSIMFFWSEPKKPWSLGKFVLHREPVSRQIVVNTHDDYIDICGVMFRFEVHWNF
jgi:hypothetical protein